MVVSNCGKNKVSVVIPTYNQARYINSCLCSVSNQTYKNIEIICVDDGSTDETGGILDNWAKLDHRVRVVHLAKEGVSISRNVGINESTGDYIMFVDSDDYLERNIVERLYMAIVKNKTDMSICGYYECLPNKKNRHSFIPNGVYKCQEYLGYFIKNPFNSYFGGPICKLFNKEILDHPDVEYESGEMLGEDFVFNARTLRYIETIAVIDECLYYFRRYSEGSLSKQTHLWDHAYYRGHCMLQEFYLTLKVKKVDQKYKKQLDCFFVIMLRFLVSHLMVSRELSTNEKRKLFKNIMDPSGNLIDKPVSYKGLGFKNTLIYFLYRHNMFRIVYLIYGRS